LSHHLSGVVDGVGDARTEADDSAAAPLGGVADVGGRSAVDARLSFWCVNTGRAYPFVFYERTLKTVIPGVQLLYCRSVDSVVLLAGPISRFLARRNKLFVGVDANGPITGLVGHYFSGKEPRYFKGVEPRLGDLAYTQKAMRPFLKRRLTI
jgi:hypothetical protein